MTDHLRNDFLPAIYDGYLGHTDDESKRIALCDEAVVNCNYNLVGNALDSKGKTCCLSENLYSRYQVRSHPT